MKRFRKPVLVIVTILVIVVGLLVIRDDTANAPSGSVTSPAISSVAAAKLKVFKHKYSLTDPSSYWVVVNKQNPLQPKTYAPTDLVSINGGQSMRLAAAGAFSKMVAAANKKGLPISPLSSYRSYQTQVAVYNNEVSSFGQTKADSESARPGFSEHQTGLAVDVGGGGCGIENCFGITRQGQWLLANAYRYGFIVRYPADKVAITGYRSEPWHIRYVGTDLAIEMHKQHIETLEEFFGLPAAPDYNKL